MDNTPDVIDSFESLLKQKSRVRPLTLYNNTKSSNIPNPSHDQNTDAQSVISHVAKQIKAIQNSEIVRSNKKSAINMNKYRNYSFMPLNELQDRVPPHRTDQQKFDTQQFSNTQLINVVEDAEALDVNIGMTQEFDTSFLFSQESTDVYKPNPEQRNLNFPILDISLKEPDPNLVSSKSLTNHKDTIRNSPKHEENLELPAEIDDILDENIQINQTVSDIDDLDAKVKETENLDNPQEYLSQQYFTQRPPSPVFSIKSKKTLSGTESPLAFDLDVFEKFEKTAMPIVETTKDFEQARFLLNFEIISNNLAVCTPNDDTEPLSPIIELGDNNFKIDKESVKREFIEMSYKYDKDDITNETQVSPSKENSPNDKFIFQDEILYSSDEEEGYHQRSYKDLPFTCALETSFYEENEVLNKTMYVGFQTASNKSIQIGTASFCRAKSLLDSIEHDLNNEGSITELVGLIDMKNSGTKNVIAIENTPNTLHEPDKDVVENIVPNVFHSAIENACNNNDSAKSIHLDDTNPLQDKTTANSVDTFKGFRTASNKPILLSEEAISKSKEIFQSMDLDASMSKNVEIMENNDKLNRSITEDEHNIDDDMVREFEEDGEFEIMKDLESDIKNDKTQVEDKITVFETAGNNNMDMGTAVAKDQQMFQDIDINELTVETECSVNDFSKSMTNIGFKTASNKDIIISEEALMKTKKVFDSIDCNDDVINCNPSKVKKCSNLSINPSPGKASCIEFEATETKNLNTEPRIKLTTFKAIDDKNIVVTPYAINKRSVEIDDKEPPFFGFDVNKHDVEMVEETLEKSQIILRKLIQSDKESDVSRGPNESLNIFHNIPKFAGFQTASNKKLQISEEALLKSKKIFQDINGDIELKIMQDTHCDFKFKGFQTASNKQIKLSESALAKSKQFFQDISDSKPIYVNAETDNSNTKFEGFKTASNQIISVSEKALKRSWKLFQDISEVESLKETNVNESKEIRNIDVDFKFKGFHTASNKKINVSEKALANSRKLFEDIPSMAPEKLSSNHILTNTGEGTKDSTFKGFHTANNKEVSISQVALAKSRKIFQDMTDNNATTNNSDSSGAKTTTGSVFKGFQTASNKEVEISAEALANSRSIFKDINDDEELEDVKTINKNSKFEDFYTASNKEVKISAEALEKSKKIFEDINVDTPKHDTLVTDFDVKFIPTFQGFQTASNKNVKVSEEAIAKSKRLLHDIDEPVVRPKINKTDVKNTYLNFKGFQTASNKKVKISEEAIAKSKTIFQDLDHDTKAFKTEISKVASQIKLDNGIGNEKEIFDENIKEKIQVQTADKEQIKVNDYCTENVMYVDTQTFNNFEESIHEVTPKKSKRSGSPILSCPKAKKRKVFHIPYSQKSPKKSSDTPKQITIHKSVDIHNFNATYKKVKMFSLKDIKRLEETTVEQRNIDPYIQQFNFENILDFKFTDSRNDVTNAPLSVSDLKQIFLNSINKKLIPIGWLDIQLKLILWKLISYELKFPKRMSLICTAKTVLDQLKYRYDKELYNAERPALRKILEKDDIAAKTLVLCVVAVCNVEDASQPPELLLTDGWYIVKAVIDKMLAKFVGSGKIAVGTKLVINGAELVGSEQAVSPWEDTSSIRLKVSGNSTRRARWDARLGYHGNAAILTQLSSVSMDGGKVSKLRVYVTRVYPPLYVDKFEDGSTVTRSERLEHLHQMRFETERQALMEKIYEEVEKEVDLNSQDSQSDTTTLPGKTKCLESGSQIAKTMKKCRDPNEFRSHLTSTQTALLENHTSKEREKLFQEIQTRVQTKMAALGVTLTRNVVTLLKVRVAGVKKGGEVTKAMLSIWRPNEAVMETIKEGTWIEILNVVPTAYRYSELQLSAGRQSIFSQSKYRESEEIKPFTNTLQRTCFPIKDLVSNPTKTTDYNEIDTVGLIFQIDPTVKDFDSNKHQFQNVFLTDGDKNIVSVNFWGGLKKFGFENVLDTGQIIAGTNLQIRAGNSRKSVPQYRATEFSYFTKTPKSETARNIITELEQKLLKINKNMFFKECIDLKNNYFAKHKASERVTPYRFPNMDINLFRNKMFIDSPIAQNTSRIDENLNLTGLDFESTFKETNESDLSPKTLLRKRQVRERIAKLKRYGEPPPLSPMQIINKSKNATNAFKSPLISKSDVSPSVAISEKNLTNEEKCGDDSDIVMQCSPVINLNRTYVKRSNPVKLDFSKNENSLSEVIGGFSEEFNC